MANVASQIPNNVNINVVNNAQLFGNYTFSNVTTDTLITDTLFRDLGLLINEERVRRGRGIEIEIDSLTDFGGTIQYAEMEKLRSALRTSSTNNPTYTGTLAGTNVGGATKKAGGTDLGTAPTFTFPEATAAFAGDPGVISAAGSWPGKPKITAALFNTIIQGLKNQGAECVCNCNYCTCNCNYCTCNCNFSCTCNCNYSDVTTKNNIVYM